MDTHFPPAMGRADVDTHLPGTIFRAWGSRWNGIWTPIFDGGHGHGHPLERTWSPTSVRGGNQPLSNRKLNPAANPADDGAGCGEQRKLPVKA